MTDGASQTGTEARSPGEAALRAAVDKHGEEIAAVLEHGDQVQDLVDTLVLVLASAEDDDVEYVADALGSLVRSADGAATEETVALAEYVGENGDDLTTALDRLVALEREGKLEALLDLGETLSDLDLDEGSVETLNHLLAAMEEAESEAEPTGVLGAIGAMRRSDAKAGLGFLLSFLRATGRKLVGR